VDEAMQGGQVVGVDAGRPGVEVVAATVGEQSGEPADAARQGAATKASREWV
jgi:hypothetical protein